MYDSVELNEARKTIAANAVVVTGNHHVESFSVPGRAPMSGPQLIQYAHFLKYGN